MKNYKMCYILKTAGHRTKRTKNLGLADKYLVYIA